MKKLFFVLGLLFSLGISSEAWASSRVSAVLTFTNAPVAGNTITVNGVSRTWGTGVSSLTVLHLGASTAESATNLFLNVSQFPYSGSLIWSISSPTSLVVRAQIDGGLTVSGSSFLQVVLSTNSLDVQTPVVIPLSAEPVPATRVLLANGMVNGISDYATDSMLLVSSRVYYASINSSYLTNSMWTSPNLLLTNALPFFKLQSQVSTLALGPIMNFARSRGTVASPAAVDSGALLGILRWTGYDGVSGYRNSAGITAYAEETFTGSTAAGSLHFSVAPTGSTAPADVLVLKSGIATVTGALQASSITNGNFVGTNHFSGDVSLGRANISAVNGSNVGLDPGLGILAKVAGPTGAFTIHGLAGGRDGKLLILYNSTSQAMTIANDSGTETTAGNRIYTLTGADVVTTGTGSATLIYDGSASRWVVIATNL